MYFYAMISGSSAHQVNLMKRVTYFLIGNPAQLRLENQVFNSMCILAIIIVGYHVHFSYFTGVAVAAAIFGFLFFALCFTYYISRFRNKFKLGIIIASIILLLMLSTSYFFNSGIRGTTLLSLILTFFLIMIVSPRKQYWLWSVLFLCTGIGLLLYEYHHPQHIYNTYLNNEAFFRDSTITFIISIAVIFSGLYYLKTAYYTEKSSAEAKALIMEEMNREKTKFFSIMSHDLRAPLASIQTYMELFRMDILTEDEKDMMQRKLTHAVNGTQEMLDNMLSWSKAQLNGGKVNLTQNNLYEALMPVINIQKASSKEKNIEFTHHIDASLELMSDIHMLQLIVRNIIGNAIKFTPEAGKICLIASKSGKHCLISVEDTGNGIPEESKPDLFSLKAQSTYGTANEKGIGLGLFLCKEYVQAQNGQIWFESRLGSGTIFYISMPLCT